MQVGLITAEVYIWKNATDANGWGDQGRGRKCQNGRHTTSQFDVSAVAPHLSKKPQPLDTHMVSKFTNGSFKS